jgi:hypothetical protein
MEKINATPNVKKYINRNAHGMNSKDHDKFPPMTRIITNNAKNDKALSIKTPVATLNGNSVFGRYIFLIKPSLLINEELH